MENENTEQLAEETQATAEPKEKTFTQEQLDEIISKRTAKYRKNAAEMNAKIEQLQAELDKVSGNYTKLVQDAEHNDMVERIAEEVGIDKNIVSTLKATDEEELRTSAKAIAELVSSATENVANDAKAMYVPNLGYVPDNLQEKGASDPLGDLVRNI